MTDQPHTPEASDLRTLALHEIEATAGASILGDIAGMVAKAVLPVMIDAVFPPAA